MRVGTMVGIQPKPVFTGSSEGSIFPWSGVLGDPTVALRDENREASLRSNDCVPYTIVRVPRICNTPGGATDLRLVQVSLTMHSSPWPKSRTRPAVVAPCKIGPGWFALMQGLLKYQLSRTHHWLTD